MKTTAEMIAVMQAYLDGKQIEFVLHHKTNWSVLTSSTTPAWDWFLFDYRVAITKPYINPEHVHPDYTWMATDSDGITWLYREQPRQSELWWYSDEEVRQADGFASFKPGTCDWKDSLVKIREE